MHVQLWFQLLCRQCYTQSEVYTKHRDVILGDKYSSLRLPKILSDNTENLSKTKPFTVMSIIMLYAADSSKEAYELLNKISFAIIGNKWYPDVTKYIFEYLLDGLGEGTGRVMELLSHYLSLADNMDKHARVSVTYLLILLLSQLLFEGKLTLDTIKSIEATPSKYRDLLISSLDTNTDPIPNRIVPFRLIALSLSQVQLEEAITDIYSTGVSCEYLLDIYFYPILRLRCVCLPRYIAVGKVIYRLGGKHVSEYDTDTFVRIRWIVDERMYFFDEDEV